ncbi:MAG TPA: HlyD family secretion protein [Rhizomicrobium sp.]|nr:HlyD family secretion protein [Rhizomicrobium sp.]
MTDTTTEFFSSDGRTGARPIIEAARTLLRERQKTAKPAQPVNDAATAKRNKLVQRASLGALLLVSAATGGYLYWDNAAHYESTDDAFIAARQFSVAPKVSGYIAAVPVTDNQHVAAGQVIARIDDRDYRTALAQAQAQVAAAQAAIANIDAQIGVQKAQVVEAGAQVEQNKASLAFADVQAKRYDMLARENAIALQTAQQNDTALLQQKASLDTARAGVTAAQRQVSALAAQRNSAEANLANAVAQLKQAELNLSYTTITAAQAGKVTNLSAAVGQFVSAGTAISSFVPQEETWVNANFKEIQLDRMRPGDAVTLRVDAYPERVLRGHVASVQAGSGTAFSLLPAENATGNYVKIVQRVPVKITIDDLPTDVVLGPGMSVSPVVRIDARPSLYETLRSAL